MIGSWEHLPSIHWETTEQSDEPSEETRVEDFLVIQNLLSDPMSTAIQTEFNMIETFIDDTICTLWPPVSNGK